MMTLSRRDWLIAALCAASVPGRTAEAHLPTPVSLADASGAAQKQGRALVVMFSTAGCPWCKIVRESYLVPLRSEGQPVVELDMQGATSLAGFDGRVTTPAQVAQALRVRVAPTLLFMGGGGRELAQRLPGVPLLDFYGAYLQERLDTANRAAA